MKTATKASPMSKVHHRPARALGDQHLAIVLAVIDDNPGKGLWALTPVVARKVRRPALSYQALRAFLVDRGITPPKPDRKARQQPRRTSMSHVDDVLPARPPRRSPITAGDSMPSRVAAPQLVSVEHVATASVFGSIFAMAGVAPQAGDLQRGESLQIALGRQRLAEIRSQRLADAQRQTSEWISAADVGRAACAALTAALEAWQVKPDDDEFNPDRPEEWFLSEMFAEQLADLFRLAVFDLARRAGVKEAAHECTQLSGRSGAAQMLRALAGKAS